MRAVPLLALLLAGCMPAQEGRRGGIVSLNPCADQLLLELVPGERITAISHYSHDPRASSIPLDVARRFRATSGTAEEVIALAPDLVVASSFTPAATREALARAGLNTIYLGATDSIAASRDQVSALARAVGEEARGDALNARIDAAVRKASHDNVSIPTLLFLEGGFANGSGTLLDEMMTRAGFRNAAADYGLAMTGSVPVETLLAHPPALILAPDPGGRTARMRRRLLDRTGFRVREAVLSRNLMSCGGSTIPAALERLAAIRREIGS